MSDAVHRLGDDPGVAASDIYDAWLDGRRHARMTGDGDGERLEQGRRRRSPSHDGYISGKNLELAPGKRIVQAWRTSAISRRDAGVADDRVP